MPLVRACAGVFLALSASACASTYVYDGHSREMTRCHVKYHKRALAQLEERYGLDASNVLRNRGHTRIFVDTASGRENHSAYYEDLLRGLEARFGAAGARTKPARERLRSLEEAARVLFAACDYAYTAVRAAPTLNDNAIAPSLVGPSPSVVPVRDVLVEDEWRVCDSRDATIAELRDVTHSLHGGR